ncbi:MAG: DUF389 domain-containing protein [Thermoleophilaceae bacterium]
MIHLRIVAPAHSSHQALELLKRSESVINVVHLHRAAAKPEGDVILCDVVREDVSIILSDLRELEIHKQGSIAMEVIDLELSERAEEAEKAAPGAPSDAVIWEEVEARTSEETELSGTFVAFMTLAMLIAMVGIMLDSTILIIGAMVVGPEFGPIAGFCVAVVQRRGPLARRSLKALAVGFPIGILVTFCVTLVLKWLGLPPESFEEGEQRFTQFIAHPDFFSFLVAFLAGTAGVLSLTSAKSGALVGVLISVTTIPAAANIGVAAAYTDWNEFGGAVTQLAVNLGMIGLAGIGTLALQRRLYVRRRRRHLLGPERQAAGLPYARSARGSMVVDVSRFRKKP